MYDRFDPVKDQRSGTGALLAGWIVLLHHVTLAVANLAIAATINMPLLVAVRCY